LIEQVIEHGATKQAGHRESFQRSGKRLLSLSSVLCIHQIRGKNLPESLRRIAKAIHQYIGGFNAFGACRSIIVVSAAEMTRTSSWRREERQYMWKSRQYDVADNIQDHSARKDYHLRRRYPRAAKASRASASSRRCRGPKGSRKPRPKPKGTPDSTSPSSSHSSALPSLLQSGVSSPIDILANSTSTFNDSSAEESTSKSEDVVIMCSNPSRHFSPVHMLNVKCVSAEESKHLEETAKSRTWGKLYS
jgi:hypothetical protein